MTKVGKVLFDWSRTKTENHRAGERVVVAVIRPEDLGRYTDGARIWRGSTGEQCALFGGKKRSWDKG